MTRPTPETAAVVQKAVEYLKNIEEGVYKEIWIDNAYWVSPADLVGQTVIDVGSNVGLFTAYVLNLGAERVIMAEPNPESWKHTEKSGLLDLPEVTLIREAVGSRMENWVVLEPARTGTRAIPVIGERAPNGIPSRPLVDIMKDIPGSMVLKLDCEGAEYSILYDLSGPELRRFKSIWLEIHVRPGHPQGLASLREYVAAHGYDQAWFRQPCYWSLPDKSDMVLHKEILMCRFNRIDTPEVVSAVGTAGPVHSRLSPADARRLTQAVERLRQFNPKLFEEIWERNDYRITAEDVAGRTLVDVGSNVGLFSALAMHLGALGALMIEPSPANYQQSESSGLTCVTNMWVVPNAAGNDDVRPVDLKGEGVNTSTVPALGPEKGAVLSLPLKTLIGNLTGPRVLKVDVEGAEYDIMYAASRELIRSFEVIWMEVHTTEAHPKGPEEMEAYIVSMGFRVRYKDALYLWDKPDRSDAVLVQPAVYVICFEKLSTWLTDPIKI